MMIRVLIDTQLPPVLSEFLRSNSFDSKHIAVDYPNGHLTDDAEIINIAIKENRVVITKDKDFRNFYLSKGSPPKVIFLQLGNCSNSQLLNYFRKNLGAVKTLLVSGHSFIVLQPENLIAY